MQSLKQMCEQEGIRLAQVSAIGAVDHAVVGVYDLQEKRYHYETERETHIDCVSLRLSTKSEVKASDFVI